MHIREVKELYEGVGGLMVGLEARYSHDDREWSFGNPGPIFGAGKGVVYSGAPARRIYRH